MSDSDKQSQRQLHRAFSHPFFVWLMVVALSNLVAIFEPAIPSHALGFVLDWGFDPFHGLDLPIALYGLDGNFSVLIKILYAISASLLILYYFACAAFYSDTPSEKRITLCIGFMLAIVLFPSNGLVSNYSYYLLLALFGPQLAISADYQKALAVLLALQSYFLVALLLAHATHTLLLGRKRT